MKRLLLLDQETQTRTTFHAEDPGQYIVESLQDVTELVELNKSQYNAFHHKNGKRFPGEKFHHVARVPLNLLFDPQTNLMRDDDALKKWLNSNDALAWRTRPAEI